MGVSRKGKRKEIAAELGLSTETREAYAAEIEIRRRPKAEGGNPQHQINSLSCLKIHISEVTHATETVNKWVLPTTLWQEQYGEKMDVGANLLMHGGSLKRCVVFHSQNPPDLVELERYVVANINRTVTAPERMISPGVMAAVCDDAGTLDDAKGANADPRTVFSWSSMVRSEGAGEIVAPAPTITLPSMCPVPDEQAAPLRDLPSARPAESQSYPGSTMAPTIATPYSTLRALGVREGADRATHAPRPPSATTRAGEDLPRTVHYRSIFISGETNPLTTTGAREVKFALSDVEQRLSQAAADRSRAVNGDEATAFISHAEELWLLDLRRAYEQLLKLQYLMSTNIHNKNAAAIVKAAHEELIPVTIDLRRRYFLHHQHAPPEYGSTVHDIDDARQPQLGPNPPEFMVSLARRVILYQVYIMLKEDMYQDVLHLINDQPAQGPAKIAWSILTENDSVNILEEAQGWVYRWIQNEAAAWRDKTACKKISKPTAEAAADPIRETPAKLKDFLHAASVALHCKLPEARALWKDHCRRPPDALVIASLALLCIKLEACATAMDEDNVHAAANQLAACKSLAKANERYESILATFPIAPVEKKYDEIKERDWRKQQDIVDACDLQESIESICNLSHVARFLAKLLTMANEKTTSTRTVQTQAAMSAAGAFDWNVLRNDLGDIKQLQELEPFLRIDARADRRFKEVVFYVADKLLEISLIQHEAAHMTETPDSVGEDKDHNTPASADNPNSVRQSISAHANNDDYKNIARISEIVHIFRNVTEPGKRAALKKHLEGAATTMLKELISTYGNFEGPARRTLKRENSFYDTNMRVHHAADASRNETITLIRTTIDKVTGSAHYGNILSCVERYEISWRAFQRDLSSTVPIAREELFKQLRNLDTLRRTTALQISKLQPDTFAVKNDIENAIGRMDVLTNKIVELCIKPKIAEAEKALLDSPLAKFPADAEVHDILADSDKVNSKALPTTGSSLKSIREFRQKIKAFSRAETEHGPIDHMCGLSADVEFRLATDEAACKILAALAFVPNQREKLEKMHEALSAYNAYATTQTAIEDSHVLAHRMIEFGQVYLQENAATHNKAHPDGQVDIQSKPETKKRRGRGLGMANPARTTKEKADVAANEAQQTEDSVAAHGGQGGDDHPKKPAPITAQEYEGNVRLLDDLFRHSWADDFDLHTHAAHDHAGDGRQPDPSMSSAQAENASRQPASSGTTQDAHGKKKRKAPASRQSEPQKRGKRGK